MNVSEFKKAAELLGRFASVRENAPWPSNIILVQSGVSALKFIGGTDEMTCVIASEPRGPMTQFIPVSARLFLQAAKSLRGRGEVDFVLDQKQGVTIRGMGGEVFLPRTQHTLLPTFPRVPFEAEVLARANVEHPFDMADLLAAAVIHPVGTFTQVQLLAEASKGAMTFSAGDPYTFAEATIPADVEDTLRLALPLDLLAALRKVNEPAAFFVYEHVLEVGLRGGSYFVFKARDHWPAFPSLPTLNPDVTVSVDRKRLADATAMLSDRVVMTADPNSLALTSWDRRERVAIPATTDGAKAPIGVVSERLLHSLRGVGGQTVKLEWERKRSGPIRVSGESQWPVLLSRIALT